MSLLEEIIAGAADEQVKLTSLLRKCLTLAARLNSKPAIDWVEWELNGYRSETAVPDYRVLPMTIKANMINIAWKADGMVVPPLCLGKSRDNLETLRLQRSVAELEHLLAGEGKAISIIIGDLPVYLNALKITDMQVTEAWGEVSPSALKNVIEAVRNRVLKFALELEREYPDAGKVKSAKPMETQRVNQIFNNVINGPANVVGTASHSNITLTVGRNDVAGLENALKDNGVSAADITKLKTALATEPTAANGKFGPKVAAWMASMVGKAATGAWDMAVDAAGSLLKKAIEGYYGL